MFAFKYITFVHKFRHLTGGVYYKLRYSLEKITKNVVMTQNNKTNIHEH